VAIIEGEVVSGIQDFTRRMNKYPEIFSNAVGEELYPGTINVRVSKKIEILPDFEIGGKVLGDMEQDFLIEKCKINDQRAYRIRPFHRRTGLGGHGDNVLEISCPKFITGCTVGESVLVEFFREI